MQNFGQYMSNAKYKRIWGRIFILENEKNIFRQKLLPSKKYKKVQACFREKSDRSVILNEIKSLVFDRKVVENLNSAMLESPVNKCILSFHEIFQEAIIFTDMEGEEYPKCKKELYKMIHRASRRKNDCISRLVHDEL